MRYFNGNHRSAGLTVAALSFLLSYQNGTCAYCSQDLESVGWEIDHRIPVVHGGTHSCGNLQLTCVWCNRGKGTMSGAEYINHCRIVAANNA